MKQISYRMKLTKFDETIYMHESIETINNISIVMKESSDIRKRKEEIPANPQI